MLRYILLILLIMPCLLSCYDDKGNYDYEEKRHVVIDGLETVYPSKQYGEPLVISSVKIKNVDSTQVLPDEQFSFEWYLVDGYSIDTVGSERVLELEMNMDAKEYMLYLGVTDLGTGITTYAKSRLLIHSDLFEGWVFLCKDEMGSTTLDMLSILYVTDAEKKVYLLKDALDSQIGILPGPKKIFFRYSGEPKMALCLQDACYLASFRDHVVSDRDNVIFEIAIKPDKIDVQFMLKGYSYNYLINNNDLYAYGNFDMIEKPINVFEGEPFKIAPYLSQPRSSRNGIFYDVTNRRFLKYAVSSWSAPTVAKLKPGAEFDWEAGWSLKYLEAERFQKNSYAILQDENMDVHLCCFRAEVQKWHKLIKKEDSHLDEATQYAFHKYAPIVYYVCDNELYEYNYGDVNPVEHLIKRYDGKEIVKMCFYNIETIMNEDREKYKDIDRRLYVAVNDMDASIPMKQRGSFYIYRVENGEALEELEVYNGLSYIIDFNYKEHSDY